MTGHHPFNSRSGATPGATPPPDVEREAIMERNWTCPSCGINFDGMPEVVTDNPLECYCSRECYDRSVSSGEARSDGGERDV